MRTNKEVKKELERISFENKALCEFYTKLDRTTLMNSMGTEILNTINNNFGKIETLKWVLYQKQTL
jgi:hypothetical protein